MGNTLLELGAQGIDGASVANPIYNLANAECLLCPRAVKKKEVQEWYFTTDGRMVLEYQEAKE